jgi:hypothetical protein
MAGFGGSAKGYPQKQEVVISMTTITVAGCD